MAISSFELSLMVGAFRWLMFVRMNDPPGLRTRATSSKAFVRSLRWTITNAAVTRSNVSSSKGRFLMSACKVSTSGNFFFVSLSISSETSAAVKIAPAESV